MPLFPPKPEYLSTLELNLGLRDENSAYRVKFTSQLQFRLYFLSESKMNVHNLFDKEYVGLNKSWKQQLKRVYLSVNLLLFWLCAWLLLSSVTEQVGCVDNPSQFVFRRCPVLILAGTATVLTDIFLWFSSVLQRKFGECTVPLSRPCSLPFTPLPFRTVCHSVNAIQPELLTAMLSKLWVGIAQSVQQLATGWTVRGSSPGCGQIFRTRADRLWGPPSLLYNGYRVFPGGKAAGA